MIHTLCRPIYQHSHLRARVCARAALVPASIPHSPYPARSARRRAGALVPSQSDPGCWARCPRARRTVVRTSRRSVPARRVRRSVRGPGEEACEAQVSSCRSLVMRRSPFVSTGGSRRDLPARRRRLTESAQSSRRLACVSVRRSQAESRSPSLRSRMCLCFATRAQPLRRRRRRRSAGRWTMRDAKASAKQRS